MKSIHALLCLAVVLATTTLSSTAEARTYTLSELLDKVGREYAGVRAAREGQRISQAQYSESGRLWAPTGDLTVGLTGSPDVKCTDGNAAGTISPDKEFRERNCIATSATDLTGKNITSILPLHGVVVRVNASITQPLYTSGKIESARALAHAGLENATDQVEAARNEARMNALRAYFGLKLARAAKSTLDDGKNQLSTWVAKIDAEIDKGKSVYSESDLIRLKIALDNATLVSLDFARTLDFTLAGVRYLTNDPEADIDDGELNDAEIIDQPLSYYQDVARTHRPEAKMLDAGTKAAVANRKLQLSQMLPDFGLQTSAGYNLATGVDDPQNAFMNRFNSLGASLVLGFHQSLDFGMKLGKYDESKAQERQFEAKREQALGAIGLEIRKNWLDVAEAKGRGTVLAHAEKVARGWYHATDQALETGVADSRDVAESARNYVELRIRHLQALMDQNIAVAVLKNSAGIL